MRIYNTAQWYSSMHMRICLVGIFVFAILFGRQYPLFAQSRSDSILIQNDIFLLMKRNDLSINEVERIANNYFALKGTGRGTGYKQYQRWLYERKFHLDYNGFYIDPELENGEYQSFIHQRGTHDRSAEAWIELGPSSWTYTSGWNPGIGMLYSLAIHPSNESIIYVSSSGGGIWKSINGGSTWIPLMDNINSGWMNVYALSIDPSNQNIIYASLGSGGIIKSTNAGTSWTATGSGPWNAGKVMVHPTNSSILLCPSYDGVWRSVNSGTSWTHVSTGDAEDIEFKPDNPNVVYVAGYNNSIGRSTDNGASWTPIGIPGGVTDRTLIAVSPNNANIVYAIQASGNLFGRMCKSVDAGLTYTTTVIGNPASGTNFFGYSNAGTDNSGQAGYDMAICVNPANADEVHIAGIICWKSIDGGFNFSSETTWSYPNGVGYNHADVHALEWINSTIYSGSDGGIYKSTNTGGDWIDLSTGLAIKEIYRISNAKTNPAIITLGAQDNGSSYRQSAGTWIDWLGADGMDNLISPTNPNIAYGTSQFGSLYKTTNGGLSSSSLIAPSAGNWITPLAMHPTNHNEIYGGWTGIWKSINGGTSWSNISSTAITQKLNTIAVAPSDVNYVYGSVNNTLYRTSNGGTSWTSVATTQDITSIYISIYNPQKIWVTLNATSNQVLFSSNMGTTFTSISSGLPAISARTVVVDEEDEDGVYVGMNIGVYYKNNINPTWALHGTVLPLVAINELEIQRSSHKLRVATYGRGVWENHLDYICSCHVTNLNDIGPGSLRAAVKCFTNGDTLIFDNSLIGQFIDLSSGPIVINRNFSIVQAANSKMKIRTLTGGPIFNISSGKAVVLNYIDLYGGQNSSGRAIINAGNLFLNNVTMFDSPVGQGSMVQNNGVLTVNGIVQLKK